MKDHEQEEDLDNGLAPEAVVQLEVTGTNAGSAQLKWLPPNNDGGHPIKEYLVEYRKVKPELEEWAEGGRVTPKKYLNADVKDLITGAKYQFRVTAVNRLGPGQQCEPTSPTLIIAQNLPPKIDRKALGDSIVCKVNHQLAVEVPVEGAPAPDTEWLKDGVPVVASDHIKVSHSANRAQLLLLPAKRAMDGVYTLTAKNRFGEDSAELKIQVLGKPEMPQGPLVVSEVSKKSCLLSWKPPSDNGGLTISHYEVEKCDTSADQWLPVKSTKGLSLQISNLAQGKAYKFMVRAVNDLGDSPDLITEEAIVAKNPFDPPSVCARPDVVNWGEDFAELKWRPNQDEDEVCEYKVEVRNRAKRAWTAGGTTKTTDFKVDNLVAGNEYEFRVVAVNQGGEAEPSPSSKPITTEIRFLRPKINRDLLTTEKQLHAGQTLRLNIQFVGAPAPQIHCFDPHGVNVDQCPDGRMLVEATTEDHQVCLIIRDVQRQDRGNYKIVAENTVGQDECQIRVDVLSRPSRPIGPLKISNVHPEGCHLTWGKPEDDGGSVITAYQIERKDTEKDVWISCGKLGGKTVAVMKELEFDVTGLIMGNVYFFRVIAVNALGEGDNALESSIPVMAKNAIDPPEKPEAPRLIDWNNQMAKLEWWVSPSQLNNINHYVIEAQEQFLVPKDVEEESHANTEGEDEGQQEKAHVQEGDGGSSPATNAAFSGQFQEYLSNWMSILVTDSNDAEATVTGLSQNHKYRFRIKAVNTSGASEPSEPSEEMICKLRKQRPFIVRDSLSQRVSVSQGETIRLSAKVQGEPAPSKKWFYGNIEIKPCASVDVTDTDHTTKLTILGARRDDTGTYKLKVSNEHGQDEAQVEVVVRVAPSKPRGPMKISDIYAEGCRCEWGSPEDDGGSPITHYLVEKLEGKLTSWIPCGRSSADQDTVCHITGLTASKEHRLRVICVNAEGQSEPLLCVDSFFPENPFTPPTAPGKPRMTDMDFDHFDLKWDAPKHDGGSRITGYLIETKLWKENTWMPAGEVKGQLEFGTASGVEVGKSYSVRVCALNAAGPGPWSVDSDQLVCKFKALKPKVTFKNEKDLTLKVGETLHLAVDIEGEPPAEEISWVHKDSNKEWVAHPGNGIYIDNTKPYRCGLEKHGLTRKDSGQIVCTARNLHGQHSATMNLTVISRPSIPEDLLLVSHIHRNGCRLSWKAPKDDGGCPPVSYIIEKCLVQSNSWIRHGTTSSLVYDISDLEPGREYAFAVIASNTVGESDALLTAKSMIAKDPFTVPLAPGAPEPVDWSERHMTLEWKEPLDDGGAAITGYHIEAKALEEDWQLCQVMDTNSCHADVQQLQKGIAYQFRVIAINKAGKSEPSLPSRPKETKARRMVPYLEAKNFHDLTVIEGDRVKFEVVFHGEPRPQVTWTKDGVDQPLESLADRSLTINTLDECSSKLVMDQVSKAQAGRYTVTVCNELGSDKASSELKVLGRPSPPENLQSSVEDGICVLLWKKSRDDGGAQIEHYQVEKFETERNLWMACGRSQDNTFHAKGLIPGKEYKFRVSAVNQYGDSDPAEGPHPIMIQDLDKSIRNMN